MQRHHDWRGITENDTSITCIPSGTESWSAPISTLENVLKNDPCNSGNATVILSNHFVRYMLVPWNELFSRNSEQLSYVQHLFSETYGNLSSSYELRLSPSAPGRPRIASAVESTLIERVRETTSKAGLQLRSIQPYLMNAFNEHRHAAAKAGGWFITVENGMLGITGIANKRWQLVRTLRVNSQWPLELESLLERLYLSDEANNIPKVLHWCSPEPTHAKPTLTAPWIVTRFDTKATKRSTPNNRKLPKVTITG
jgi:hypothetical protein